MVKNHTPTHAPIHDVCPLQKLTYILSDAWTILIIRDLLITPKRFCELERSLSGISTRTLTLKLTKLVDEEVAHNIDHYYTLTNKGKHLQPIIRAMEKVGAKM